MNNKLRAYLLKNGKWETLGRWELIKMSETDYRVFKYENFATQDSSKLHVSKNIESKKLTFNRGQKTFRYYSSGDNSGDMGNEGMTIVHMLAQEIISEMQFLNLEVTDRRYKPYNNFSCRLKVSNTYIEQDILKGKYKVDLLIRFEEPEELALKWNKSLAIEVFASHEVKGDKILDFDKCSLPLIELNLSKLLRDFKGKKKLSEITEKDEEELRQKMTNFFRKKIFADLLVDTASTQYLENKVIQEHISKNNTLLEDKLQLETKLDRLERDKNILNTELIDKTSKLKNSNNKIFVLRQQIDSLTNRSFIKVIFDMIRKRKQLTNS